MTKEPKITSANRITQTNAARWMASGAAPAGMAELPVLTDHARCFVVWLERAETADNIRTAKEAIMLAQRG